MPEVLQESEREAVRRAAEAARTGLETAAGFEASGTWNRDGVILFGSGGGPIWTMDFGTEFMAALLFSYWLSQPMAGGAEPCHCWSTRAPVLASSSN